jgi:hypothetical protein
MKKVCIVKKDGSHLYLDPREMIGFKRVRKCHRCGSRENLIGKKKTQLTICTKCIEKALENITEEDLKAFFKWSKEFEND